MRIQGINVKKLGSLWERKCQFEINVDGEHMKHKYILLGTNMHRIHVCIWQSVVFAPFLMYPSTTVDVNWWEQLQTSGFYLNTSYLISKLKWTLWWYFLAIDFLIIVFCSSKSAGSDLETILVSVSSNIIQLHSLLSKPARKKKEVFARVYMHLTGNLQ